MVTHDPFYPDIIGACVAVDGDPDHALLIEARASVAVWDKFLSENETIETDAELFIAAHAARDLNPQWYLNFSAEQDPTTQRINDYLANRDPERADDDDLPEPPDASALEDEIDTKITSITAAREAQNKPFLRHKRSSKSRKTAPTGRANTN